MPIQEEFNCFEPKCWLVTILRPVAEAGRQKITAQEEIARAFEKATAVRGSGTRGSGPYATVCIPERLGMAWPLGRGRNVRDGTFPDFSAGILITMAGVVPAGWSTATPGRWWSTSVFNQNGRHVRCVSAIRHRRFAGNGSGEGRFVFHYRAQGHGQDSGRAEFLQQRPGQSRFGGKNRQAARGGRDPRRQHYPVWK